MLRPRIVRAKIPKVQPQLNLPPGLKIAGIRRAEHIPTSYVTKNYPLETYRESHTVLEGSYPLMKTLVQQLVLEVSGLDPRRFDSDDIEEGYFEGVPISIATVRQALVDMANSPTLFTLFDKAFAYSRSADGYGRSSNQAGAELILRKEKRIYDSDEQTIGKIKKKIFAHIQKYRHAKKRS